MAQGDNDVAMAITVVGSQSFVFPDDRVIIVLKTLELGLIGFPVKQEIIDMLREELDEAEGFVRQACGES
jgi:hypothetical protein